MKFLIAEPSPLPILIPLAPRYSPLDIYIIIRIEIVSRDTIPGTGCSQKRFSVEIHKPWPLVTSTLASHGTFTFKGCALLLHDAVSAVLPPSLYIHISQKYQASLVPAQVSTM